MQSSARAWHALLSSQVQCMPPCLRGSSGTWASLSFMASALCSWHANAAHILAVTSSTSSYDLPLEAATPVVVWLASSDDLHQQPALDCARIY